ncbi:MAG: hypothetical protein KDA96_07180 [Planctomycetaceae bacterium]|nr:hypothetical protein [Planctomycetaceae bacterium]
MALTLLPALNTPARAQDDNRYRLHVLPFLQLDSLYAFANRTHSGTTTNVLFASQPWMARSNSITGATVRLSTDHSFVHVTDPGCRRDARLRIRQLSAAASSGWKMDVQEDQTDHAAGDEIATVQASSTAPGNAVIFLDVTFLTGDLATLKGGDYRLTVVGTISEN